jgi:hypothetical protein
MRKGRIVGFFAGAGAALYLVLSGLRKSKPSPADESGEPRRIGPVMLAAPIIIVLLVGGVVLYLMFSGPHMRDEPKFTAYRALLPAVPAEIVPVSARSLTVPPPGAVPQLRNPLPDTERTRRTGQMYYGYYCVFCHGQNGRGDGPAGLSYVPTPTDLTSPSVQSLSDGALYRAMLTGVGHAPVLPYVILPGAPWYIVDYVRHLPAREEKQSSLTSTQ